jgi:photosystem II stability/assembly factor-like uncharacterized protein
MRHALFALLVIACGDSTGQQLAVQAPAATTAGLAIDLILSGVDSAGRSAPFSGTVHFSSSDPAAVLPADSALSLRASETRSFAVVLRTAGAQAVNVQVRGEAHGLVTATVAVGAAPAVRLVASIPESCAPFHLAVAAADPFGNVDATWRGTVRFSSPQATVPDDYVFGAADQGRHAFAVAADAFAVRTVVAADPDAHLASSAPVAPPGWCGVGPDLADVDSVVVDPSSPATVYAATFGGIYQSRDGGATWAGLNTGLAGQRAVFALAAAPGTPSRIYAGVFGGLYALAPDRQAWLLLPTPINAGGEASAIAVDPNHAGTVFVGTGPGVNGCGILRSSDSGASWAVVDGAPRSVGVRALAIDPTTSAVYAAPGARSTIGGGGVLRSPDSGTTWVPAGLATIQVSALAVSENGTVYAGSDFGAGLFASKDGGATWSNNLLASGVTGLATFPGKPGSVLAATTSGAFLSQDSGATWTTLSSDTLLSVTVAPGGAPIYAGAASDGVRRSDDGTSWSASNAGMRAAIGFSLASNPSSGTVYAGTRGGWVFSSKDRGETWSRTEAGAGADVEALLISPQAPSTMFASVFGVARSIDSGVSWTRLFVPDGATVVRTLAMDPADPRILYAGAQSGLLKSTDAGDSWAPAGLVGAWIYSIAVEGSVVYANTSIGFFRSFDGAATWAAAGSGLPAGTFHPLLLTADGALYTGGDSTFYDLYKSVDGGSTFVALKAHPPSLYVLALASDPADPAIVYAASESTVIKSSDAGKSWHEIGVGLPPTPQIRALLVDPSDRRVVYAATQGMSVYRTTGGGD